MFQLVQASVSENQAWRSVKFQNEIKVLVLDTEPLRIPAVSRGPSMVLSKLRERHFDRISKPCPVKILVAACEDK